MGKQHTKLKVTVIFIITLISLSSLCFLFQQNQRNIKIDSVSSSQNPFLEISSFSQDNYSSILEQPKNGVGEITVTNISFHEKGFDNSTKYDALDDDIGKDLNVSYSGTLFLETMVNASKNYLKDEYIDNDKVRIKLRDKLDVSYDNNSHDGLAGFMVYLPRLTPSEILKIQVDGTILAEDEYSLVIDNNNNEFVYFDYFNYFGSSVQNDFSMNITYSYDISFITWEIDQLNEDELVATEPFHNFEAEYKYQFYLKGDRFSGDNPTNTVEAENLTVGLIIELFDKDDLDNFSLALNEQEKDANNYQISSGIFNISLDHGFTANSSYFELNFTSAFQVRFQDPVSNSWAIDRLLSGNNIRQRIYIPQVLNGPEHLLLKYTFYEPTILNEQIRQISSQFGRNVIRLPVSAVEDPLEDQGILIYTPSLILGEYGCPFSIKYEATNSFRIIITDNINMPLWDVDVKVYYNGLLYGTYISNNYTQPLAPLVANENGEIILDYVPNGNYRLEIYQGARIIKSATINTSQETHYISTSIIHFPSVVLAFGIISVIILGIGILLFLRNKKRT
ncbi:MAG: hypothetical protein GF311_11945 [Candidatus Lokiarchaeota archaeon]|nr:hypothetical protein [Candidatus Lokiarchaeota archaeon]